jgi:hypothetical protein
MHLLRGSQLKTRRPKASQVDSRHASVTSDRIAYRRLLATDDIELITELLHESYAPLAAAGMHFVAAHQSATVTEQRMDRGETFVAADGA